jgi:hypothetical protein
MATLADAVRQAMGRPDAKTVRFFLAGRAADWDVEEWALRDDVQRWSTPSGSKAGFVLQKASEGPYEDQTAHWLRLFRPDGSLVPTKDERAEAAEQRADTAEQRAEQERRAEIARLRAQLGLDTDS